MLSLELPIKHRVSLDGLRAGSRISIDALPQGQDSMHLEVRLLTFAGDAPLVASLRECEGAELSFRANSSVNNIKTLPVKKIVPIQEGRFRLEIVVSCYESDEGPSNIAEIYLTSQSTTRLLCAFVLRAAPETVDSIHLSGSVKCLAFEVYKGERRDRGNSVLTNDMSIGSWSTSPSVKTVDKGTSTKDDCVKTPSCAEPKSLKPRQVEVTAAMDRPSGSVDNIPECMSLTVLTAKTDTNQRRVEKTKAGQHFVIDVSEPRLFYKLLYKGRDVKLWVSGEVEESEADPQMHLVLTRYLETAEAAEALAERMAEELREQEWILGDDSVHYFFDVFRQQLDEDEQARCSYDMELMTTTINTNHVAFKVSFRKIPKGWTKNTIEQSLVRGEIVSANNCIAIYIGKGMVLCPIEGVLERISLWTATKRGFWSAAPRPSRDGFCHEGDKLSVVEPQRPHRPREGIAEVAEQLFAQRARWPIAWSSGEAFAMFCSTALPQGNDIDEIMKRVLRTWEPPVVELLTSRPSVQFSEYAVWKYRAMERAENDEEES